MSDKSKRVSGGAALTPKATDYPTVHIRWVYVVRDRAHVLQQEWRLGDGTHEWRDVPMVLTGDSGVSFG